MTHQEREKALILPMRHLDADCIAEFIGRLGTILPDAAPKWGKLRRDTLMEHLVWAVRHSMGRSKQVPFFGNWLTVRVAGPLYLRGLIPTPKNAQFPKRLVEQGVTGREPGDLDTLHALLLEYVNLVQADELSPAPHPLFGAIGVDDWDRMHVRHFEHHLRQFGV